MKKISFRTSQIALATAGGSAVLLGLFMLAPGITAQAATNTDTLLRCPQGNMREHRTERRAEHLKDASQILGMETNVLEQKLKDGKTFAEIAEEIGMTGETFREKMEEKRTAHLAALVTDGSITQAQMDAAVERMEKREETGAPARVGKGGSMGHTRGMQHTR